MPKAAQKDLFPKSLGHSHSCTYFSPRKTSDSQLNIFFLKENCPHWALCVVPCVILQWLFSHLYLVSAVMDNPFTSAGWRGDLIIVGAFEESGVAGAHLQRSFTRDVGGTSPTRPGLWVEELARVVRAVAEARAVETGVTRLVDLLCCVALHEQVHGHDACTLQCVERHIRLK